VGDRYGGEWVPSAFREWDIAYEASDLTRSEIYLESEVLFARGCVKLLDRRELLLELRQLERKTGAAKDKVDHPPRSHDDYANSACGALWLASKRRSVDFSGSFMAGGRLAASAEANSVFQMDREGGFENSGDSSWRPLSSKYDFPG
jgi:hypothetical protein